MSAKLYFTVLIVLVNLGGAMATGYAYFDGYNERLAGVFEVWAWITGAAAFMWFFIAGMLFVD